MIKIIIKDIKTSIDTPASELKGIAAQLAGISLSDVEHFRILKMSLDARKRDVIHFNSIVEIGGNIPNNIANKYEIAEDRPLKQFTYGDKRINGRPVVIGAGPCGLFAAYTLALNGYKPIILERGSEVSAREEAFNKLREFGELDCEDNVCFGEGGAGAFSDGKLTTRIKSDKISHVLNTFVEHGANEDITYLAKPHLGTDVIRKVVAAMRKTIEKLGAKYIFNARFSDYTTDNNAEISSVVFYKDNTRYEIATNCVILAIGHSARDTYSMLLSKGVFLEAKPFAMGVRVEHKRELIDVNQYGKYAGHAALGAADYKLRATCMDRGVFSFCMCPGGEVVCSATEEGMTAVNGMSYSLRDASNSNSAIVCTVRPEDYFTGALGGIQLQRSIEKKAFLSARGYGAVAMNISDFIAHRNSKKLNIASSYKPYVEVMDYSGCFPDFISAPLRMAMAKFENNIRGFKDGIMLGVETRTSSPVRIIRNDTGETNIGGLYPAGEGAGYAGGIVSAAVDGIRAAESIMQRFCNEV